MTPISKKDELMNALKLIKQTCKENEFLCSSCPMFSEETEECAVSTLKPSCWQIAYKPDIWMAVR